MGIAQQLRQFGKAAEDIMRKLLPPEPGMEDLAAAVGYVEYAGSPVGALTPEFVGQRCLDTVGRSFYVALGTASADWTLEASPALGTAALLLMGGDHPYAQWGGNGMLAAYLAHKVQPYIAVNSFTGGPAPGDTDTLSWSELAAIKSQAEICDHGTRHIQQWYRINTGIRIQYSGAAGSATVQITSSGVVLTGNGGAENATLTFASYPTIATMVAAISAQGGGVWTATAAAELSGAEASGNLMVVAARNVKASTNNQYFAAGGGIVIRYTGKAFESVFAVRTSNPSLDIFCDGVRRVNLVLSNPPYDTITEVVAGINAAGISGLTASICDNGRAETASYLSYVQGDEDAQNLKIMQGDVQYTYGVIDAGLPRWYMIHRQMESSAATAAANGITYTHFAQSGNGFFEPMAQFGYESYRGVNDPNTRAVSPYQVPAALGNPRFTIMQTTANNAGAAWTAEQGQAVLDAMADSGPFVVNLMCHKILPDGSSSYSFPNPDSYYNLTEAAFLAILSRANTYISAGAIRNPKPSELPALRRAAQKPKNFVFNPKFRNDGSTLLNANDSGFKIPGWYLITSNSIYSAVSVTDDTLTLTATASTATDFAYQELTLEPGKTYEFGCLVEITSYTSGNGVRITLSPKFGRWPDLFGNPTNEIMYGQRIAGTASNGNQIAHLTFRFAVPRPQNYRAAKVIGNNAGPFNLGSSPADVKININSLAQINVNCAGATPTATTTDEVVAALNAAIAGSSSYPAEYRNCVKNVAGKVVITSPYLNIDERHYSGYGVSLDAGTTNSATSTIFGASMCRGISMAEPYADGAMSLWYLSVRSEMIGTFSISKPYVREVSAY